jgi:hypothetical protein
MNKKYIAFSFMAVLAVTLVSAGLVSYLSDPISGDVSVASPITLSGNIADSIEVYGGESITREVIMHNNANVPIITHSEFEITAPTPWTSNLTEFDTFELKDTTNGWIGDLKNPLATFGVAQVCFIRAGNALVLDCVLGDVTIQEDSTITYELTAGFNRAIADGDYSFSVQVMN